MKNYFTRKTITEVLEELKPMQADFYLKINGDLDDTMKNELNNHGYITFREEYEGCILTRIEHK